MSDIILPTKPSHRYTWKPPLPGRGARDIEEHADITGITILDEVDPRPHMPAALNQGQLGTCTANATNRAFRYDTIQDALLGRGKDCGELSRLWTYYFERWLEGTVSQGDVGAQGHEAYSVAKHGIPDETLWPYVESQYQVQPPNLKRAYTLTKKVVAPAQTEEEFMAVLSNNQTITYGFTVYKNFEEEPWAIPGCMPLPTPGMEVLGGHENLICGRLREYPDYFLSLNSWGTGWGVFGGYFLIPKSFVLDPTFATDFRTIVRPL